MVGTILLSIAGFFALIIVIGLFIPSKYSFSRTTTIDADKRKVFNTIDDLTSWKQWSAWSPEKDHRIAISYGDKTSGTGAQMFWKGGTMGKGEMQITSTDPYQTINLNAIFNKGVFKMEFTFKIESINEKSVDVSWIVAGKTKRGGFAKLLGRFLPKMMGKDMETALKILKHLCEGNLA